MFNLGNLLANLDLDLEALECSKKALECEKKEHGNNTLEYTTIQQQIGNAYFDLDQLDVALSWYHRARVGIEKQGRTSSINFGLTWLTSEGSTHERIISQKRCRISIEPRPPTGEHTRPTTRQLLRAWKT